MSPKRIPVSDRILNRVAKQEGACWLWQGCFGKDGYGVIGVGKHQKRTHRVAYECFVGEIPNGMLVCHTCDQPACVNPNHLFLGTAKENYDDMVEKGRKRAAMRDNRPSSNIKQKDIQSLIEMRKSGKTLKEISVLYGVSFQTVSRIYLQETKNGTENV